MQLINDKDIKITVGQSRKSTSWITQNSRWSDFIERISKPIITAETYEEFIKYSKSKQDDLKDVGGFVAGTLKDNRRKAENVIDRCIVTLDADNIAPGQTQNIIKTVSGLGCAYAIYSTRKHCGSKPRLRILIPLDREVQPNEYEAIARKIASLISMAIMDGSTFEASRLMYWPSHSINSEFVFAYEDKPFASSAGILGMYSNWKDCNEWPKMINESEIIKREIQKQKDPLEKQGIIGAFCKTYDIHEAIQMYLNDIYTPGVADDKYTYITGSVANGATVYDNAKYMYSYHATDPATKILCNSFDLVRIHKFSELDDEAKPGTPATQLPSFKAMCNLAIEDKEVSNLLKKEKFASAVDEFSNAEVVVEDKTDWEQKLILTQEGNLAKCARNILIILENDPALKDKLIYDRFTGRFLVTGKLPWYYRDNFERYMWTDADEACLRNYLDNKENNYNFKGPSLIKDALCELKMKKSIHVVQDYLKSITWDGVKRLDTLLVDFLGTEDNVYARQIIRKTLVAAVTRAMEERCVKFDSMPILVGPQGIGKSTFLKKLGREWFTDSVTTFEGKDTAIVLQRCLIVEIAELAAFGRMETNRLKQSISSESDLFREPYDREAKEHPRHCVFFGTTNDREFLKDRTGNRRYWPIITGLKKPIKSVFNDLDGEVDQIWAEAYEYYRIGEKLYLEGEAQRQSLIHQEMHRETSPWEGAIKEFVSKEVPRDWSRRNLSERKAFWALQSGNEEIELVERDRVCAPEIWCECLGNDIKNMKMNDSKEINSILESIENYERSGSTTRFGCYGIQRGFLINVNNVNN